MGQAWVDEAHEWIDLFTGQRFLVSDTAGWGEVTANCQAAAV
jgi:hypothetical protein